MAYNTVFTIAFSVDHDHEDPWQDTHKGAFYYAALDRIADVMRANEWYEALEQLDTIETAEDWEDDDEAL